jgi:hypothetical protein
VHSVSIVERNGHHDPDRQAALAAGVAQYEPAGHACAAALLAGHQSPAPLHVVGVADCAPQ